MPTPDQFYADEEASDSDYPPAFKFGPIGSSLVGTVLRRENLDDQYNPGHKIKVYEIKQDDGIAVTLWNGLVDLRMKFKENEVDAGDRVAIVYKHDEPPKVAGRNPTKKFDVTVKKANGNDDSLDTPADVAATSVPEPAVSADSLI